MLTDKMMRCPRWLQHHLQWDRAGDSAREATQSGYELICGEAGAGHTRLRHTVLSTLVLLKSPIKIAMGNGYRT